MQPDDMQKAKMPNPPTDFEELCFLFICLFRNDFPLLFQTVQDNFHKTWYR